MTVVRYANRLGAAVLVLLFGLSNVARAADDNPLRPLDTSSPRATLQGFVETLDELYLRVTDVMKSYAESGRLYLTPEERQRQYANLAGAAKVIRYLDTSEISPVLRDAVAAEGALQLKEVLDRIELPAFDDIPNQDAVARSSIKRWRLPGTEIDIILIENGPRAGEWLVSAHTLGRLPEFYERVKTLSYKPGPAKQLIEGYNKLSSDNLSAIYEAYLSSPFGLSVIIPTRWMLSLPGWARTKIADVAVWQWFGIGIGMVVGLLFIFGVYRLARYLAQRRGEEAAGPGWHSLLTPLAIILLAGLLGPALCKILRILGTPLVVLSFVQTVALFLSTAWLSMVGASVIGETIVKSEHLRAHSMDSQLIRLSMRFVGIVVAIGLLMEAATELGFPAFSVLAGLGVGGLAVALAARDSLANLLGSILIMFEKPFRVGHMIRLSGAEGTVEDVGFRSTRIRTADNSVISIPNNSVVNATVENLTLRAARRQRFLVQVTYGTHPEKMEAFSLGIEELLTDNPLVKKDNFNVRFNEFGETSLNILVVFHLEIASNSEELKEREKILYDIMALAKKLGIEFAVPAQTLQVEAVQTA